METKRKSSVIRRLYRLCPAAHWIALLSAGLILLHLLTRHDHALMNAVSTRLIRPLHARLALLFSALPFSVAELLFAAVILAVLVYITLSLLRIIRREHKLHTLYRLTVRLTAAALGIYAGYCMMWGVYFYGDDFASRSGFARREISVEELECVTRFFASRMNEYGALVTRDEHGLYAADRDAILARSDRVYEKTEQRYPCLAGPSVRVKGMLFSRIMSYLDYTGFFFPFTAEANVNTDFPLPQFAATVAHELSHQRGVAKEEEANFVAVLACLDTDDPDFLYSGCVSAFVYLGNALYDADYAAWESVMDTLELPVVLDLAYDNAYWDSVDTPINEVSNGIYDGFLQSYGQELGVRSYGACVDLLVAHYLPEARGE